MGGGVDAQERKKDRPLRLSEMADAFLWFGGDRNENCARLFGRYSRRREWVRAHQVLTLLFLGLPGPLDFGIQVRVVEIIVVPEDAERVLGK